jgi:16S rRNA (cytosine967-C5)-methyltransferase
LGSPPEKAELLPGVLGLLRKVYGEALNEVLKAMVRPPASYHIRANTLKISPNKLTARLRASGLKVFQHSVVEEALAIPVEGPNPVPNHPTRVVVDKFTAESVMVGAHVYAPGVSQCHGLRKGDEVSILSPKGHLVGAGSAEMGETEILTFRTGLAVRVIHPLYKVPSLRESEEYREGLLYPQSLPSMVTVKILEPKPGETIVDLNCAPGGKLSHIYQLTEGQAEIYGFDRSSKKIEATRQVLTRLGCKGVKLAAADSRYVDIDFSGLMADRVLVDPPCSALGVTPKLYSEKTVEDIVSSAHYQRQFLKVAAKIVKPGGVVVYSVCTMTLEECEETAKFALECGLKPDVSPISVGMPGLSLFDGAELFQRFHPHLHGFGYFIARFRKPD